MYLSDEAVRYLAATGPTHSEIHEEMAAYAEENDFPIIGRAAGGLLRTLARVRGATRVFEFGSGFGYSALWFLQGMPADGEIVLTEIDHAEIEMAEEFLDRAGYGSQAIFEQGDAMGIIEQYDQPFDAVLIDHQKYRYADAFETIREQLPVGSVVIADNIMRGAIDFEDLLPYVERGESLPDDQNTQGIASYLDTIRDADGFHTTVLPVGEGLALTTKERQ